MISLSRFLFVLIFMNPSILLAEEPIVFGVLGDSLSQAFGTGDITAPRAPGMRSYQAAEDFRDYRRAVQERKQDFISSPQYPGLPQAITSQFVDHGDQHSFATGKGIFDSNNLYATTVRSFLYRLQEINPGREVRAVRKSVTLRRSWDLNDLWTCDNQLGRPTMAICADFHNGAAWIPDFTSGKQSSSPDVCRSVSPYAAFFCVDNSGKIDGSVSRDGIFVPRQPYYRKGQVSQLFDEAKKVDYLVLEIGANDICYASDFYLMANQIRMGPAVLSVAKPKIDGNASGDVMVALSLNVRTALKRITQSSPGVKTLVVPIPDIVALKKQFASRIVGTYPLTASPSDKAGTDMSCQTFWNGQVLSLNQPLFNESRSFYCSNYLPTGSPYNDTTFAALLAKANTTLSDAAKAFPNNARYAASIPSAGIKNIEVSPIDCFHPTLASQNRFAELAWKDWGLTPSNSLAQPVVRTYHVPTGLHFFNTDSFEVNRLITEGQNTYESYHRFAAYRSNSSDLRLMAIHQLENPDGLHRYLTTSISERDALIRLGWRHKGVLPNAYVFPPTRYVAKKGGECLTTPGAAKEIYHGYRADIGDHYFTTSKASCDWMLQNGWEQHTSLGYGLD